MLQVCPWDLEVDPEAERRLAEERKRKAEEEAAAAAAAAMAARAERLQARDRATKVVAQQEMGEEDDDEYVPTDGSSSDSGESLTRPYSALARQGFYRVVLTCVIVHLGFLYCRRQRGQR